MYPNAKDFIAYMDESGFETVFLAAFKMFSHRDKVIIWNNTTDEVYEQVKQFPDRLVGAAGYNPYLTEASLKDIDRARLRRGMVRLRRQP